MEIQYDLVIVGAGVLGSFAAFHALRQNKRVLLIEAGASPRGATVRNFGQVVPSGQGLNGWRQLGIRSTELYREVCRMGNIPLQSNGSLYVASDEEEQQLLHELIEHDRAMGYPSQLFSAQQCRQHIPPLTAGYVKEGVYYPDEITLDSPNFLPAMLELLKRDSQLTYLNSAKVHVVESDQQGPCVRLVCGECFRTREVLVCSGHVLNHIEGLNFSRANLTLVRLQMLASQLFAADTIKGNLLTGLSIRRYEAFHSCPSYSILSVPADKRPLIDAGIHLLFKQAPNGELIIGDSHHYYDLNESDSLDFHISSAVNDLILTEARKIIALPSLEIARSWNGYYAQDLDRGVYCRTQLPGIHVVSGIGGKGMTCGPGLMERVVEAIFKHHSLNEITINPIT